MELQIKNNIKWIKVLLFLTILAFAYFMANFFFFNKPIPKVSGMLIKSQNVVSTINTSGVLYFENIVTIKSEASGRLVEVNFKEGDIVKQNAVLAVFQNADQQIALRQAENNLNLAYQSLESIKTDQIKTADEEILQANAELQKAQDTHEIEQRLFQEQLQINDAQEKINETLTTYNKKKSDYERTKRLFDASGATNSELENSKYDMELALSKYNISVNGMASLVPDKALKASKSNLEQAQSKLRQSQNKKQTLLQGGNVYENAQIKIKEAQIGLDNAKKNNAKTIVYAPFDGIVLGRILQAGEYGNVGDKLFTLAKQENLYIRATLDEKYVSKTQIGQKVSVYPQGVSQTINGTVRKILPSADSLRGIINLEIALDEHPQFLKNEMTVNIDIITNTYENAIAINKKYLTGEKNNKIFVVRDKMVKIVDMEMLADLVDKVVVKSGVNNGDTIIEPGKFKDGDKVEVSTK